MRRGEERRGEERRVEGEKEGEKREGDRRKDSEALWLVPQHASLPSAAIVSVVYRSTPLCKASVTIETV